MESPLLVQPPLPVKCVSASWSSPITPTTAVVRFDIPADLPESTLGSSRTGIFWELHAHLPLSGLDYRSTFRLPVLPDEALTAA